MHLPAKKLIGISLIKNVNKNDYPLLDNIEQHRGFYDEWIFIAPMDGQDSDGTVASLQSIRASIEQRTHLPSGIRIAKVDWPSDDAFFEESIDKTLQMRVISKIRSSYDKDTWFHKHDIDEFLCKDDQDIILNMINVFNYDIENTMISTNWIQLVKSTRTFVFDPTRKKNHFVRNIGNISFIGNDASDLETDVGHDTYLSYVYTYHTGYVKTEDQLTNKIKEHIKLNESIYLSKIDMDKLNDYKFSFPENKAGTRCWPLGLCTLMGQPNEAEYFPSNIFELPEVLKSEKWLDFNSHTK